MRFARRVRVAPGASIVRSAAAWTVTRSGFEVDGAAVVVGDHHLAGLVVERDPLAARRA